MDLLYQATRIDCAIYCAFGIEDYLLRVVVARFRVEVTPTIGVQPLAIELVNVSGCETRNDMTFRAREPDIDLEHIEKREPNQLHILEGLGKRSKIFDQLLRGQQGRIQCSTCEKLHNGAFSFQELG